MSTKLGCICKFQSGGTPSKSNQDYYNGGIPWVTTTSLNGKQIDARDAVDWITEKAIDETAAKIVPANSIMVGTRVGIGKVAVNLVDMSTSQDIISLLDIDDSAWDKDFLCKYIQGKNRFLKSQARGATIKGIKIDVLANLDLPEISIDKQRYISTNIDKVNQVIELRKKELEEFDELIKARFVELFGDMADPRCKWDRCKLIDACADSNDIKCGPFGTQLGKDEYTDSGVEVWEIPQINSEFKTMPTHFVTKEKAQNLEQYSIRPGDIAMSRKGNVGRCAVFPDSFEEGIIHSDVLRIRVDGSRVAPEFMMRQLHYSGDIQHQIELVSSGAIMAGINVTKLKDIFVYVPPKTLQDEFVSFVKQVDKSKVVVQKALDEAQLLFDSLMQEYFG